jgi:hypothetical protein
MKHLFFSFSILLYFIVFTGGNKLIDKIDNLIGEGSTQIIGKTEEKEIKESLESIKILLKDDNSNNNSQIGQNLYNQNQIYNPNYSMEFQGINNMMQSQNQVQFNNNILNNNQQNQNINFNNGFLNSDSFNSFFPVIIFNFIRS